MFLQATYAKIVIVHGLTPSAVSGHSAVLLCATYVPFCRNWSQLITQSLKFVEKQWKGGKME